MSGNAEGERERERDNWRNNIVTARLMDGALGPKHGRNPTRPRRTGPRVRRAPPPPPVIVSGGSGGAGPRRRGR